MIRKLTISDFEKVEPMMAALHKIHVENRNDFYSENAHPITTKEFKAMLKDKNKIALTFAENGEIAGIALATIKDRTVRSIYIDAIFVLEPFRRRGIATRLFRQSRTLQARSVLKEWIRWYGRLMRRHWRFINPWA